MKFLIGVLIVLLLALQYKLWVADNGLPQVRRLEQELASQQIENQQLRTRNQVLQAEVDDLKQGLAAIEEHAREDLGMIKQGETFYQIIEQSKNNTQLLEKPKNTGKQ